IVGIGVIAIVGVGQRGSGRRGRVLSPPGLRSPGIAICGPLGRFGRPTPLSMGHGRIGVTEKAMLGRLKPEITFPFGKATAVTLLRPLLITRVALKIPRALRPL